MKSIARSSSVSFCKPKALPKDVAELQVKKQRVLFANESQSNWNEVTLYLTETELFAVMGSEDVVLEMFDVNLCRWCEWSDQGEKGTAMMLVVLGSGTFYVRCNTVKEMDEWARAAIFLGGSSEENGVVTPCARVAAAIFQMQLGDKLYKYGRRGDPHFRQFKLSADGKRLDWNSRKKGDSGIQLKDVRGFSYGQKTANFQRKPMPEYENQAMSLITPEQTLDIVCCKNDKELQMWSLGFQFLVYCIHKFPNFRLSMPEKVQGELQALGGVSSSGMSTDNDLYLWGRGEKGQLGVGNNEDSMSPVVPGILLGKDISLVAVGKDHCGAVIRETGELFTWGNGQNGRLGHGDTTSRNQPKIVNQLTVVALAAGDFHTLAVDSQGQVHAWGMGYYGQLGLGNRNDALKPTKIDMLSSEMVTGVACSSTASFATTRGGGVFYWGLLDSYNVEQCVLVPRLLEFGESRLRITQISCGDFHAAAITDKGELYTFGDGSLGQLGHGSPDSSMTPTKVEMGGKEVEDVACGAGHTVAISGGRMYMWGLLLRGGEQVRQLVPMQEDIPDLKDDAIVGVSSAAMTTAIVTESGKAFVWGVMGSCVAENCSESDAPKEIRQFGRKKVRGIVCGANYMVAFVMREWIEDAQVKFCMLCKAEFTAFFRRHHCRKCGGIYCNDCSSKTYALKEYGHAKNVRVCDTCHTFLSNSRA